MIYVIRHYIFEPLIKIKMSNNLIKLTHSSLVCCLEIKHWYDTHHGRFFLGDDLSLSSWCFCECFVRSLLLLPCSFCLFSSLYASCIDHRLIWSTSLLLTSGIVFPLNRRTWNIDNTKWTGRLTRSICSINHDLTGYILFLETLLVNAAQDPIYPSNLVHY